MIKHTHTHTHTHIYMYIYTVCVNRTAYRKWNRGRRGLHQLGQTIAPSIPFPV